MEKADQGRRNPLAISCREYLNCIVFLHLCPFSEFKWTVTSFGGKILFQTKTFSREHLLYHSELIMDILALLLDIL